MTDNRYDSDGSEYIPIALIFGILLLGWLLIGYERIQEVDPCPGSHSITVNNEPMGCLDDGPNGTTWIPNIEREVKPMATLNGDRQ